MESKNRGTYGFLGTSWVLITMAPRKKNRCYHYSVANQQQLSCPPRTATSSVKFEKKLVANVVGSRGLELYFSRATIEYLSNDFTAVRAGASTSRRNFRVHAARNKQWYIP